jgi:predicted lactoylglutathione lyase
MLSFHYNMDFKNDVTSFVIVHKNNYGLLLHNKHV